MKIISKFKDYYDFLSGVYGEDPLIVLDRREGGIHKPSGRKVTLYLGGYTIDGFNPSYDSPHYNGGKIYWGDNLKAIDDYPNIPESYWKAKTRGRRHIHYRSYIDYYLKSEGISHDNSVFMNLDEQTRDCIFYFKFRPDLSKMNEKLNCPILVKSYCNEYFEYPSLVELNLNSYVKPEEVYQMINAWLSERKTLAENRTDNRTNTEKLISKGFDKITSFRPTIKK